MRRAKVDSARALIARDGSKLRQPLSPGVACSSCTSFSDELMTGRTAAAAVTRMIRMCFAVYTMLSESCPRMVIVGIGVFADKQNLMVCLAINAKRVYRIMRQNALLLERKPAVPPSKRAHTGRVAVKESNQRWCSDGFEFRCDNGEKLRVTFALDCCDREALHWAVTTGGFGQWNSTGRHAGSGGTPLGSELPASPVEWLTDNGSCYRANETRQFAVMLGLEPKNTAVRSPESNGIAESFVKTIKRDYISIMPKPDGLTAAKNLAEAFEHYNEWHPHSALGYRSPVQNEIRFVHSGRRHSSPARRILLWRVYGQTQYGRERTAGR